MPSPSNGSLGQGPEEYKHEEIDTSLGYEARDVRVVGVLVFIVALAIFAVVSAVLCYGIGKVINARMNKEDGPTSKWAKVVNIRQLGNLPSNPAMQDKVAQLMESFPTPRLLLNDGDQQVANLHAREDLLMDHYSWINQAKGQVRIPIERAMELIAQQGLPVAPASKQEVLMTGDSRPVVTMPLTDGFAPTGFEQQEAEQRALTAREQASK